MSETLPAILQPGLRAYIVYDQVPEGCSVFEVHDNRMSPHVSQGEFVLVDESDRAPMHGEMFVIQWSDGGRQVVEVNRWHRQDTNGGNLWMAQWQMTMICCGDGSERVMRWGDGPYFEAPFADKLVGRVVGILQPDFRKALSG
jgi:hypothetical protein